MVEKNKDSQTKTIVKKEVPSITKDNKIEVKKDKNIYHVSQNKAPRTEKYKLWRVRLEGSDKTIKYFPTQEEAINYAKQVATNNNGQVVIHKLRGQIRKNKY